MGLFLKRCLIAAATVSVLSCSTVAEDKLAAKSYWVVDQNGEVLVDPQTSGLAMWRGQLVSIADGSAKKNYRMRLLPIDPATNKLAQEQHPIRVAESLKDSCFGEYLKDKPDLEALVVDPDDDTVMITVTEDASRITLSDACLQKYQDTGSTQFPTLIVRLKLQADNSLIMTHVRPLQFDPAFKVGDFPNDGIEGMTYGAGETLYLGLEKDMAGQPRIFSLDINKDFWQQSGYAKVSDPELLLPSFSGGNHPINGLSYYPEANGPGFIVAAARNDNQLWFVDVAKQVETVKVDVDFLAEVPTPNNNCQDWELMDNYSLEGVAVDGDKLWMINDPWKVNYRKNIICASNKANYEAMAPLLTWTTIKPEWVKR